MATTYQVFRVCMCLSVLLQSLYVGQGLDDDYWHTVRVKRRLHNVALSVDNSTEVEGKAQTQIIDCSLQTP